MNAPKKHSYPSDYGPGKHWSVDEAWKILDLLPVGMLPDNHRFLMAGNIAGALMRIRAAGFAEGLREAAP